MPDPDEPFLVARVGLSGGRAVTAWERELSGAIWARHSSREPFSDVVVPPAIKAELAAAARAEAAILRFPDDNEAARVRRLTADAERELRADPAYRAELARWAGPGRVGDGMPSEVLGPRSAVGCDPARHQPVRYADFEDRPQLVVLSVREQSADSWITAGQALERAWLTATCRARLGLEYPQMIMRTG